MTASAGSVLKSFALQLNAAVIALSINATSVAFGDVGVNAPATQPVILTSTGTVPVTINGATLTGAGFTLPGATLPATLNPNQERTLNIEFDPTAVGAATGQLTITSNSSTNGTAAIGLSGTGTAAPAVAVAVTPATVSVTTGATQQFAASIKGTSNTAVTWTASGTGCSGTTCGTISSTGLYTAPATAPSPATVTITATSVSDPSKSASAAVTIVPSAGTSQPLACSGTQPAPTTAPTQAAAAGFNTLDFDDEFNSPDTISPNNEGHYNWYTWNVYGTSKELSSADYEVSNGCLTIFTDLTGSGADLQTVNSGTATTGLFQYGYFEARIQFNPIGSEGGGSWPAFWSDALQSIPEISPFAELDFMEAVPNGKGGATTGWNGVTIITTAHQWTKGNGWNDTYNTNNIPPMPASFNYDAFHIYGCLWSPSSVTWYIDNQPVMTVATGPGTDLTAFEQEQIFLILGTGKNWPTTFDYVRVWH
jgi:beta-glucanase (GH16 family)